MTTSFMIMSDETTNRSVIKGTDSHSASRTSHGPRTKAVKAAKCQGPVPGASAIDIGASRDYGTLLFLESLDLDFGPRVPCLCEYVGLWLQFVLFILNLVSVLFANIMSRSLESRECLEIDGRWSSFTSYGPITNNKPLPIAHSGFGTHATPSTCSCSR